MIAKRAEGIKLNPLYKKGYKPLNLLMENKKIPIDFQASQFPRAGLLHTLYFILHTSVDCWAVGDRVRLIGSAVEGTVVFNENQPFLGGYLPYIYVRWDNKTFPTPIEPELLVRVVRFIPEGLTWKAEDSFSGEDEPQLEQVKERFTSYTGFVQGDQTGQQWNCPNESEQPLLCESLLVGIENSPSKCREQGGMYKSENSPSNDILTSNHKPSKNRRNRGEGNGTIHWRTMTKNGQEYPQAYYHWKENGQKRTKYIQKRLLEQVLQAEEQKRPVIEILEILGVLPQGGETLLVGMEDSPSTPEEPPQILTSKNSPSTASLEAIPTSKNSPSTSEEPPQILPSKNSPSTASLEAIPTSKNSPSKTRRSKGNGCGSIQWKTITLNGKDYPQPWYHYEVWQDGNRITKKSKYIPKRLLAKIQELEAQKAAVREILAVLGLKV